MHLHGTMTASAAVALQRTFRCVTYKKAASPRTRSGDVALDRRGAGRAPGAVFRVRARFCTGHSCNSPRVKALAILYRCRAAAGCSRRTGGPRRAYNIERRGGPRGFISRPSTNQFIYTKVMYSAIAARACIYTRAVHIAAVRAYNTRVSRHGGIGGHRI